MNKQMNWNSVAEKQQEIQFSGSIYVREGDKTLMSESFGYANRSEKIINQPSTRFSIASGSKIFTSIAICQLVEEGALAFDTKLSDCLDTAFPHFDEKITIHHLLTHTSGVPDYFDEDEMDDYEMLWENLPMYRMRSAKDFLPMFRHEEMQDKAGSAFEYNNAGYILLGLVIEQISGLCFTDYIEEKVFKTAGMMGSGYFSMDELPGDVATGYMEKPDGGWKSNIYSLPVKGGPDGGAYVTAADMGSFWGALMSGRLLSEGMARLLLAPRENVTEDIFYGYGGYMESDGEDVVKYIQMGYDPGVNYRSVHYPDWDLTIIVCSNHSEGAYEMLKELESLTMDK